MDPITSQLIAAQITLAKYVAYAHALPATVPASSLATLQAAVAKLAADLDALPQTLAESPDGTSLNSTSGHITDATGAVWTLVSGAGLVVQRNGVAAGYSANVTMLWYARQAIYQTNGSGWWSWSNNDWATATDPRGAATSGPAASGGTGPAATGGVVAVDFGATTGKKVVRELYGVSTATMLDFNFALCGNTAFQAASKSLNVPLLRFNCNSGASGGNVWLNAFPNGPRGALNAGVVAPLVNNLNKIVDLASTKVIMGFGGVSGNDTNGWSATDFAYALSTVAKYFRSAPGSDGNPINIKYWEIMNEIQIDMGTYAAYFNASADALHAIDPSYVVMGPAMPNNFGEVSALISGSNASRVGMLDGHFYLYCPGPDPVPSDDQACLAQTGGSGTTPEVFAAGINSATNGTFAASLPFYLGEYNIGCGPSDTNNREQSIVGACFAASCLMKLVMNANPVMWCGLWEYGTSGGWGTMDGSGGNIHPQGYFLSKGASAMPGTVVSSTAGNGLLAIATVNGGQFGVTIVNPTGNAVNGQVALGHWPVNGSGSASIHQWVISPANLQGAVSTVSVTSGMTAQINFPARSVMILYP